MNKRKRPVHRSVDDHLKRGGTEGEAWRHLDEKLDEALDETFPASDPVQLTPGDD